VLSPDRKAIGRIEEIRAEPQGDDFVVSEYHVGAHAVLERLSAWRIGNAILRLFHLSRANRGYRVPWDRLDLSDPRHPRLTCDVSELKPLRRGSSSG